MPSWAEVVRAEPELASSIERLFALGRHKTIATLRADGSPRISGIECDFVDGQLRFGSMAGARKVADLRRDPRFALHGPTADPVGEGPDSWSGEAKIAGRALHVGALVADDGVGPPGELFVADVLELTVTRLDPSGTRLVVEWWTPAGGRRLVERD